MELRVKGAKPRMEALKNVIEDHGVTHMAAICAICKTQFSTVFPYYGFRMDQIVSVHQLVSNAIVVDRAADGAAGGITRSVNDEEYSQIAGEVGEVNEND